MNQEGQKKKINHADEISVKDVIIKFRSYINYLKSKWVIIFIITFLGGLAGLLYSILQKPNYIAVCTFVIEESSKGGALSQYAGLASLAGINMGNDGGGIFEGDNIIELYKSRLMIEQTLLSTATFNNKKELLIERYIDYNKLRKKWIEKDNIDIKFDSIASNFNRTQDSLMTDIVEAINRKILNVSKPDKKLNIVNVEVTAGDELFAKEFTNKLVENVNTFYINTKTKKTAQNLRVLQKQVDSVKNVLNSSISGVASAIDAAPNANPSLLALRVPSQKKQVDVQASTAIYGELVKNLELEKISLRQETPLLQVIDKPVLPLMINRVSKIKGILAGLFLGATIVIGFFIVKKFFSALMQ